MPAAGTPAFAEYAGSSRRSPPSHGGARPWPRPWVGRATAAAPRPAAPRAYPPASQKPRPPAGGPRRGTRLGGGGTSVHAADDTGHGLGGLDFPLGVRGGVARLLDALRGLPQR